MVDDRPEDTGSLPDSEPAEARAADHRSRGDRSVERDEELCRAHRPRRRPSPWPSPRRRSPKASVEESPVAGAAVPAGLALDRRAGLRRGCGCAGDWRRLDAGLASRFNPRPRRLPRSSVPPSTVSPPVSPDWSQRSARPCPIPPLPRAPRPLEKTVAALRTELAATRAQGEKLASAINDVKSAPRGDGAASPDLSGIDERIAKIESQMRTQGAEIAQQGSKLADTQGRRQACRRHAAAPPGVGGAARCAGPDRRSLSGGARRRPRRWRPIRMP